MDVLDFIGNLILNGGLLIIVVCLGVGEVIKRWVPNEVLQSKFIPVVNACIGGVLAVAVPTIFPEEAMITTSIYGAILGLSASGIYNGVTSFKKEKDAW